MKNAQGVHRAQFVAMLAIMAAFGGFMPTQSAEPAAKEKLAMKLLPSAKVTVLVENMAGSPPVLGEWGVAFFIEAGQHRILFDTGGGRVVMDNAKSLGIDLATTEAIVISHGHDDHVGGLKQVLGVAGPVSLFIHPSAFVTRYWNRSSRPEKSVMPLSREQLQQEGRKLVDTKGPTAVCDGVMVTGQIPRITDFEDTGVVRDAFLDEELKHSDPIEDDQALFFRVPEGVVIVLGCGHAGVVNTMEYVCKLLGEQDVYAVIGGAHLVVASPERMQKTIEAMKKHNVQKIMLSHCTSLKAFAQLDKALPGRCTWPAAGTRIQFG